MTMREIADVIRKINGIETPKLPPARILIRKRIDNDDSVFNKLVPIHYVGDPSYDYLEDPNEPLHDPWDDLDLGMPND